MTNQYGTMYSQDAIYATMAAGSGVTRQLNYFGSGVGLGFNGSVYFSYLQFAVFDLTDLPTDVDHAFFQQRVFGYEDRESDFTVYVAPYDYGSTLEAADWLNPGALAALTPIASFSTADLNPSGAQNMVYVEMDLSGITLGGVTRVVIYTDKQRDLAVPTTGPGMNIQGVPPSLILKRDYVDPGASTAYSVEVLTENPEIYWTLDDPPGTVVVDSSPNGNDGTLHAGITNHTAIVSDGHALYSPAISAFTATTANTGWLQSQSPGSFAAALAGSSVTPSLNTTLFAGGLFSSGNWDAFETFIEFDTSTLSSASRVTLVLAAVTEANNDFPQTLKVAAYDYGTLDATDWRNATQLGALTVAGSVTNSSNGQYSHYEIDIDPSAITIGGTTRLILYTDAMVTGTAPTTADYYWLWNEPTLWPPSLLVTEINEPTYSDARDGVDSASYWVWPGFINYLSVGQEFTDSQYRTYETFLEFDLTAVTGTAVQADLTITLAEIFADTNFNLKVALYDYGTAVTSGDFRTGSQLAGLTDIATIPITTGMARTSITVDLLGIVNAGDMVRIVVYSDRQSGSGVAPTGKEYVQINDSGTTLFVRVESANVPTLGVAPLYLTGTAMLTNSVDGGEARSNNDYNAGQVFTNGFAFEVGVEFTDFSFGYGVPCGFEANDEIDLEYYTNNGDDPTKALLSFYDGSTQYYAEYFILETNTPYHMIGMYDPAGAGLYTVYVNGDAYWYSDPSIPAGMMSAVPFLAAGGNPWHVGADGFGDAIDGTVDEASLYFSSFSDARARVHYKSFISTGGPFENLTNAIGLTDTAIYRVHPARYRLNQAVGISGSLAPIVKPKTRILNNTVGIEVFELRANELRLYSEILRDTPYVYYRLDEAAGPGPFGSTPFRDSSGNGYDLDVVPSATYGVASLQHEGWGASDFDPAAAFVAGGSSYAQTNNPVIPPNTDIGTFAIEAIIKPYAPEGSSSQWAFSGLGLFILRVEHQTTATYSLTLQWDWGDSLNYSIQTVGVATWNYGDVHQVIVEWDGTNANLYVDGALIVTAAKPHGVKTHTAFGANMILANGNYTGALDEVAFYDHELGSTRVAAHYDALLHGSPSLGIANFADRVGLVAGVSTSFTGVPWSEIYQVTKPDSVSDPSFSPDGTLIVFAEHIGSAYNISTINADGTGHTVLVTGSRPYHDPQYSADGDFILYSVTTVDPDGGHPLGQWAIKYLDPDGTEFTIVNDEHVHIHPVWITPTQIAFQQIRYGIDGTYHIILMDVAGHLIADDGVGEYPRLVQV